MSVTFYLRSTETLYPACPRCGATLESPSYLKTGRQDCPEIDPSTGTECLGFGFDWIKNGPEINLCNASAKDLLIRLGFYDGQYLEGSIDPTDLLIALESLKTESLEPMSRMISVDPSKGHPIMRKEIGFETTERRDRYVTKLQEIAEIARRRGEPVIYN